MKLAIVLFNLGGPDQISSVEPFLFNLFKDKAIINLPGIIRLPLARFIAWRRGPVARKIYENIGGCSPLLEETEAQANYLNEKLKHLADEVKVFISMRYWHPFSQTTASAVKSFDADRIILLPLYPHYSSTTTGSSFKDWKNAIKSVALDVPTSAICCYPSEKGFIAGQVKLIKKAIINAESKVAKGIKIRVLFSAHGLPKKVINAGDPYQWQIEKTATAVVSDLKNILDRPSLDWVVCYQSRVGPLEWIGPSLDQELIRAGKDQKGVVVVPIAFVSEHSETLVELDIEYREKAEELKLPTYLRVPALSIEENFIDSLANSVEASLKLGSVINCQAGKRQCPPEFKNCPLECT
jgi:ferrochelatase